MAPGGDGEGGAVQRGRPSAKKGALGHLGWSCTGVCFCLPPGSCPPASHPVFGPAGLSLTPWSGVADWGGPAVLGAVHG